MKRWNELLEGIKEETPANSASGGAIAGLGDEPPVRKNEKTGEMIYLRRF